mmetsp:Transcript_145972/g.363946  ORF Transcript_145972/g.363946 Transcript_145972/m.363946 type:complete len:223 (-) Transcript_145972:2715-3383(-)
MVLRPPEVEGDERRLRRVRCGDLEADVLLLREGWVLALLDLLPLQVACWPIHDLLAHALRRPCEREPVRRGADGPVVVASVHLRVRHDVEAARAVDGDLVTILDVIPEAQHDLDLADSLVPVVLAEHVTHGVPPQIVVDREARDLRLIQGKLRLASVLRVRVEVPVRRFLWRVGVEDVHDELVLLAVARLLAGDRHVADHVQVQLGLRVVDLTLQLIGQDRR